MITLIHVMDDIIFQPQGGSGDIGVSHRDSANFLHIAEMIEEYGPDIGMPHTAPMGNGLFEIRAKGKEGIGRALFCIDKGKVIIILHSFIKKTQKTPVHELDKARRLMKELK